MKQILKDGDLITFECKPRLNDETGINELNKGIGYVCVDYSDTLLVGGSLIGGVVIMEKIEDLISYELVTIQKIKKHHQYLSIEEQNELLNIAKNKYPIGTLYICDGQICKIKGELKIHVIHGGYVMISDGHGGSVYFRGCWAKIN